MIVSDLNVAAALESLGFAVSRVERRPNSSRAEFIIEEGEDKELIREVINNYWNGELKGSLRDFARSIKELKARLYAHDGVSE